jgi:GT2 family glycosyltransferase
MVALIPANPKVGVVLLNWHNWLETSECLDKLTHLRSSQFQLITIVVDNGSQDESVSHLEKLNISHFLPLPSNLGYAGGCNEGIRTALTSGCDYVLLLNSDIAIFPDFLDLLFKVLKTQPEVGIAAPKIINEDKPAKIYYAGGKIFPFRMKDRLIGIGKLDSPKYDREGIVDFGIGCCLLIKGDVFKRVGYLDKRFFFDYEDIDFCYRAHLSGFRTWYEPRSNIIHKAPLLPRNRHRAYLLGNARVTFFFKYVVGLKFWPAFFLEWIYTIRVMLNHIVRNRFDLAQGYLAGVVDGTHDHFSKKKP